MLGARAEDQSRAGGWFFEQAYLLLSLSSLFWAGNVVLGRFIAGHIPPITLSVIRWSGAVVLLLPFAARHLVRDWPLIRKHAGLLTFLALTGFSAYNTMAYYGLQFTTAINGLLLQSVAPLFVAVWSFFLFRDRLTLRQAGGICLSLAGVLVIISHGSLDILLGIDFNRGDVWLVVALLVYAFYAAILRKRPRNPSNFIPRCGHGAWAPYCCLPGMVLGTRERADVRIRRQKACLSLVYICVFPSLLGYLFLNRGIELVGANRAAPFIHLVPVFGSVLAIVLLGESFELFHAIGYALVFAGITIATRR